jgi:hypothetical protein
VISLQGCVPRPSTATFFCMCLTHCLAPVRAQDPCQMQSLQHLWNPRAEGLVVERPVWGPRVLYNSVAQTQGVGKVAEAPVCVPT